ncbi:MAG: SPOR domain-containing protein, partial [Flavobacteriaceae bacterium]|nr:SPOR domain-containing protein [Flavobacteriaceae bacterium]
MHLDTYISDLLYRYDCVTIPSFGAFLTERVSAQINEESGLLSPPRKRLSFNEQLQKNDGLLATYIANTENIPYEVAVKKVERHVKSIKSYLVEGETITIQNVGELLLNKDGKVNFEPFYKVNYLTGSFGLSPISSNFVIREEASATVRQLEENIPLSISPEKRRKKVPYVRYAAVAVIALMLGGVGGTAIYSNQIEKQNQLAQEQAAQELDSKIQEATFVIP